MIERTRRSNGTLASACIAALSLALAPLSAHAARPDTTAIPQPITVSSDGDIVLQLLVKNAEGRERIKVVAAELEGERVRATFPVLHDDGTHGDRLRGDGVYSLLTSLEGAPGRYKVTYYVVDDLGVETVVGPAIFTLQ